MAPRQPSLFGENSPASGLDRSLIAIAPRRTGPLSKKEKAFHRLLARVQSLEQRLVARKQQLDAALAFHAREVRPRQERSISMRKELLRRLMPFMDDRRLKAGERHALAAIMANQLDDVLLFEELTDQDLCALFERLHGARYADAAQQEIDEAQSALAETLAEMGLAVELPKLRLGMTDEDIAAAVAQMMDGVVQQASDAVVEKPRGPTKRSGRAESAKERLRAFEEKRKAGITALYRRLVKALHPDLEPEPQARARKSALMQDVTSAYARQDFHALMRIELAWFDRESTAAAGLSDETLGTYHDLLREQAAEIEDEYNALLFHPRYEALVTDDPLGFPMLIDGPAEVDRLEMVAEHLRHGLDHLSGGEALTHVRGAIREYRQAERHARTEWRPQRRTRRRRRRR